MLYMRQNVPQIAKIHQNLAFLFRKIFFFYSSIILCKTRWFFSRMQFGRPHQISNFFSEIPLCTKYYFSFFFALGCSKGGHTCQWLSDVYYYGPGLLRSWWLVEILEHITNWIIQLFFVFFFGGVSRGATCQCLSIVCYHEPGWLRSLCLVENVGAHSFAMDVCWAGWGSANH